MKIADAIAFFQNNEPSFDPETYNLAIKTLIDGFQRLDAERKAIQNDSRIVTCVYCGHQYAPGTPASNSEALKAHVMNCSEHPLRYAIADLAAIKDSVILAERALGCLDSKSDLPTRVRNLCSKLIRAAEAVRKAFGA